MSDEKRMDTALLAENDENTAAEENAGYEAGQAFHL